MIDPANSMIDPTATAKFFVALEQHQKARTVLELLRPHATGLSELNELGGLYSRIKDFPAVSEISHHMLTLTQDPEVEASIRINIIRSAIAMNQVDQALTNIDRVESLLGRTTHDLQLDRAVCYFLQARRDQGEKILRQILTEPRSTVVDSKARFNLGMYEIMKGNFREGLRDFIIYGKQSGLWRNLELDPARQWQGGEISGPLLTLSNGGIGDEIVNIRFQRHLERLGIQTTHYSPRADVAAVFRRCGFRAISDREFKELGDEWWWCDNMTVPVHLGVDQHELWSGPYLTPARQAPALPGGRKVGIKCRGNPLYEQDLHRSLPEADVISAIPKDHTIYSFHIDDDIDHPRAHSLRDRIQTWDDTLDYIDQMDVIVSSCTSIAHAAAAMGKETYVLVPRLNYYVWALPGDHSPWYGSEVTVLRQTQLACWQEPLSRLKQILHDRV